METLSRILMFMSLLSGLVSGFSLQNLPVTSFEEGYTQLFGDKNLFVHKDGKSVLLTLDERTGSGFVSNDLYLHGFFSASIKLPSDYSAGVVVAFYMSNGDMYEKNHDEIDFEFLGNIRGNEWRIQTNIYGNGEVLIWEEKRDIISGLILLKIFITTVSSGLILISCKEVKRTASMGGDFPSKPMSLYTTIWDGSKWATNGGKYGVNYKYAPYIARFSDLVLHSCPVDPIEQFPRCEEGAVQIIRAAEEITSSQRDKMYSFRRKHMTYSYCYDQTRYKVALSESVVNPAEAQRLRIYDPVTFGRIPRRHRSRKHRSKRSRVDRTESM